MGRHAAARQRAGLRRARALLAGGLVLGVGATLTLASWVDDEYAQGSFTASSFDTQSSVDGGGNWADNTAPPGPVMAFDVAGMSPSTVRYGSLLVRTKPGSIAGTLALSGAVVTNGASDTAPLLGDALRYRVVLTTGACTAAAFAGTPSWVVGGPSTYATLTTGQNGGLTTPVAAAAADAPGTATGFCFEVTLPAGSPNALQGKSAGAVWQVTATSTD